MHSSTCDAVSIMILLHLEVCMSSILVFIHPSTSNFACWVPTIKHVKLMFNSEIPHRLATESGDFKSAFSTGKSS